VSFVPVRRVFLTLLISRSDLDWAGGAEFAENAEPRKKALGAGRVREHDTLVEPSDESGVIVCDTTHGELSVGRNVPNFFEVRRLFGTD
jgi:hypothetical protein